MKRILVIEDDKTLSNGIMLSLKSDQYEIIQFYTIVETTIYLQNNSADLLILDINLPDGNGLDFLKEFRVQHRTSVILLTANDLEIDIVTGLELGANDYITKPFSLAVLRARVKNQLRGNQRNSIISDDFCFDFESMEFSHRNYPIELSKTEQKLLKALLDNQGMTVSRESLLEAVWGIDSDFVDNNALSVTIKRLRDKLEDDPAKPAYINTVYGIGYSWRNPHE